MWLYRELSSELKLKNNKNYPPSSPNMGEETEDIIRTNKNYMSMAKKRRTEI